METWKTVWNNKSAISDEGGLLGSLVKANGFDTGCGEYSSSQWLKMTSELVKLLGITKKSKVLEVGCGSGALIYGIQIASGAQIFWL